MTEEILEEESPEYIESWYISIVESLKILTEIVRGSLNLLQRRTVI
jgi:hypothetical protein